MKKKIIGILVCTLLITTALPAVGMMNEKENMMKVFPSNNSLVQKTDVESYIMSGWIEESKLLASDGETGGVFGWSVSIDGDYAIIGAKGDDDSTGSAYVLKYDGSSWTEEAKLTASDGVVGDRFGTSVSINGDYTIIGAPGLSHKTDILGSAYIFKRTGATWEQEAKLLASDGEIDDHFGWSVSIDGDYAIIGAPDDDDNGRGSGSAYVFKRTGTSWAEEQKLTASDGESNDNFGYFLLIDGEYAIIGAPGDDDGTGSAYVFKHDGTVWAEEQKLLASDGASDDEFGRSVSIDGEYAIIGAPYDDDDSAYVFKRTGTSWAEEQKLTASDDSEHFGWSVSINGDYAIIGANYDDSVTGTAYVFKRTGTSWAEEQKLLASDGASGDEFGRSVSIDGECAIIGAPKDNDLGSASGSAYVFRKLDPNAPYAPTITGETSGKKGTEYEYTFNAEDPDGDDVKYHIDWEDGNSETTGFNPSGTDVNVKHTWSEEGTYTIKATAEDTNGLVGPEGTLTVTMPRNKPYFNTPFLQFLQNFLNSHPNLFPILRHMLGF